MIFFRRLFTAVLAALLCAAGSSVAQTWPVKPIRIVSNSAAGSPGDISLRLAAPRIGAALGQPLVVEQKGGGGGMLAATDVQRNGPDGYAILFSSSLIIGGRFLLKNVTVDLQRDFVPISMASRAVNMIGIHSSVPAGSLRELVDYARKNPGKLSVSSNGIGSSLHLQWLGFFGFYGPLGLPMATVNRLSSEIQKAYKDAEIVSKLEAIDIQAVGNTPEEFAAFVNAYVPTIGELVKAAGLSPQ